jgi:hypothetical protein
MIFIFLVQNAGFHLEVKTINRSANLKLPVDIDTYIVGIQISDE